MVHVNGYSILFKLTNRQKLKKMYRNISNRLVYFVAIQKLINVKS